MGSGRLTPNESVVYMSVEEPRRVWNRLPVLTRDPSDALPRYVGYLGFTAGRSFDVGIARLPRRPNPLHTPEFLFGDYRATVQVDMQKSQTLLIYRGHNKKQFQQIIDRIRSLLTVTRVSRPHLTRRAAGLSQKTASTYGRFRQMVSSAKDAIAAGDIYQANLSLRFERRFRGDPCDLYADLCERNPSPYAALLKCGDHWLVSNSPELLVRVENRRVVTRPIAGTRPRGANTKSDSNRRGQLLLSPKERAEHIMLVDLERNDVGRVCKAGSVRVTERFSVEKYSHVMHIVSQVEGRLAKNKTALDAVRALFPGGTITGCPKIRSIDIIEGLECVSRGPFYGSAGFVTGRGDATFNILIRTALIKGTRAWVQAGAGIVADSAPLREYNEINAKAAALLQALGKFK